MRVLNKRFEKTNSKMVKVCADIGCQVKACAEERKSGIIFDKYKQYSADNNVIILLCTNATLTLEFSVCRNKH